MTHVTGTSPGGTTLLDCLPSSLLSHLSCDHCLVSPTMMGPLLLPFLRCVSCSSYLRCGVPFRCPFRTLLLRPLCSPNSSGLLYAGPENSGLCEFARRSGSRSERARMWTSPKNEICTWLTVACDSTFRPLGLKVGCCLFMEVT